MIKKYYQSLNSLKYSFGLTGFTLLLFILAFLRESKGYTYLTNWMIGVTVLLLLVMFFYYKGKINIHAQLKPIQNIEEYRNGGMVDKSWILKDRILAYYKGTIKELWVKDIQTMDVEEGKHGSYIFIFNHQIKMSCKDLSEGRRLLAILRTTNANIQSSLTPEGNGSLVTLGGIDHE